MGAFRKRRMMGCLCLCMFCPAPAPGQTWHPPGARPPEPAVTVSALAGASLSGPTLGVKARFANGLEAGLRHAQLGRAFAEDLGLYFVFPPDEEWMGRPYVGTEFFRSNRDDRFRRTEAYALLLTVGREHRVANRLALSYDLAGGALLRMRAGDLLPPLTAKARAQVLCRIF
jgi:hypothetical protein